MEANTKIIIIMNIRAFKCFSMATSLIVAITMSSCGGNKQSNGLTEGASGDMEAYEQSDVNAVEQARPTIMVIPGDLTLQNFKCLTTQKVNGRDYILRDYKNYLLKDDRAIGHPK